MALSQPTKRAPHKGNCMQPSEPDGCRSVPPYIQGVTGTWSAESIMELWDQTTTYDCRIQYNKNITATGFWETGQNLFI